MYFYVTCNPHNYPEELDTTSINLPALQVWKTRCIH